ncbi:CinA family protein [Arthrobacter sp. zg-Y820]|uniref:CinA family protein n=1 Tax=unclassified Arthrobacter TaxID=235627 RepID=UPI001E2D407F|nr:MULTISPECIES: CinA family protein [unclassified Arthrobacter]MCC9195391.1 CinA family protein [Arthrobacter sp. zg-Y820]MDK1278250.1 CinA family protein [Arthrobacter sp. zg.Y820]WIB10131.1 CinA family protein [Arthrobacter sp. zg-Y820]
MSTSSQDTVSTETAERIAERIQGTGVTIGVSESLTSGMLASFLGAAPSSSDWFLGGLTAYATSVKRTVLGVTAEAVVSEESAAQMAAGTAKLLDADLVLAVTGSGGPEPQDDQEPGTVFFGLTAANQEHPDVIERFFEGDPETVIHSTVAAALELLEERLEKLLADRGIR